MSITFSFQNKFVVVTGGARGIGLEVARQFLKAGARVEVWDFSKETIAEAKQELIEFTDRLNFQQVDVSDAESVTRASESLNSVDILVNNAGITRDKSVLKMSVEDFDAVIATNLRGVFLCTSKLLSRFSNADSGKRIINIASVVALYGNFGQTNYVAAKAGVIGMTRTWSRELARKGFTTNAVAPGFTETSMVSAMPSDVIRELSSRVPVNRLGQPRDIANAVLFLASEEASYINGAVLSVDGGLVC